MAWKRFAYASYRRTACGGPPKDINMGALRYLVEPVFCARTFCVTDIRTNTFEAVLEQRFKGSFDQLTWNSMEKMFEHIEDPSLQDLMMNFIMRVLKQT